MVRGASRSEIRGGTMDKEYLPAERPGFVRPELQRWPRPDHPDDLPSDNRVTGLRKLTVAGLLVSGLFFGAFSAWVYFAELASAALAPGVVKVSSNHKSIQHHRQFAQHSPGSVQQSLEYVTQVHGGTSS